MINLDQNTSEKLEEFFRKNGNIIVVYLYGSQIKGNALPKSDLDMVLVMDNVQNIDYEGLYSQINGITKNFDLDLRIATTKSDPIYLFEIIGGRCIYKRSDSGRINFETTVLRNFYDGQHRRDIYYRYLKQSFGVT